MEQSAARGRYREITLYLLPPNEMSNIDAILLAADELVDTNEYTIITPPSGKQHRNIILFLISKTVISHPHSNS